MKYLLSLFIISTAYFASGQSLNKVYSEILDSNEYIRNFEYINNKLFFEKGKYLYRPGQYCSHIDPLYIEDNNIYTLENGNVSPFVLSYLDKSKYETLWMIDSTNLLSRYEYFSCSDTSGVFLPINLEGHYWKYNNDNITLIKLKKDTLISSYYPIWFGDKLLVYIRDSIHSGQLFYFDRFDLSLHSFINESYEFRVNYPLVYDSLLVFNTYNPYSKDHQLYTSNYEGNIRRVTYFPRGLYHFNQEVQIDSFLYLRLQDKGIPDNYDNKIFGVTSFWKLNLRTKEMTEIEKMPKYGITYGSMNIESDFVTLYGNRKYQIYRKEKEGNFINISDTLSDIKHCLYRSVKLNSHLLTIGIDTEDDYRLILVGTSKEKTKVSPKVDEIIFFKAMGELCFILFKHKNALYSIEIITGEGLIKQIRNLNGLQEAKGFEILNFRNRTYILLVRKDYSELYTVDMKKLEAELILDNITNTHNNRRKINDHRKANYQETVDGIYFISKTDENTNEFSIYHLE